MSKRKRRRFTAEFKTETVRLIEETGQSIAQVSRELGLTDSAVRHWVKQAKTDAGGGDSNSLTTQEKALVRKLRKELREVRMERDFLKKATAFFAKESS